MSIVTEDTLETAVLPEREPVSSLILATLRDGTAVPQEYTTLDLFSDIAETAAITDAATGGASDDLSDAAVLNDAASPMNTFTKDFRESVVGNDRAVFTTGLIDDAIDTAVLNDGADLVVPLTDTRDTAQVADAADSLHTTTTDFRETAVVTSALASDNLLDVREVAVLNDASSHMAKGLLDVREVAAIVSNVDDVLHATNDILETAVAADSADILLTQTADLRERGFLNDLLVDNGQAITYTANVETWATSYYDDYAFDSIAGEFAAGPGGVYKRGEGLTYAEVKTGRLAHVDERPYQSRNRHSVKMVPRVYAHVASASALAMRVVSEGRGAVDTVDYVVPVVDALSPTPNRVKMALGAQGTHWTYRITNPTGRAFKMHHVDITFAERERGNP